jgi:hypothetical protein
MVAADAPQEGGHQLVTHTLRTVVTVGVCVGGGHTNTFSFFGSGI